MVTYTQSYQNPISLTNSSPKRVHFEDDTTDVYSEELSTSEENFDEDYSAEDESSEGEHETNSSDTLLVLEQDKEQKIEVLVEETEKIIRAPKEGMIIKAHSI
ncbi:hypothetical protein G6F57_021618 [Rhizopus arrhizus]|nr:hypothetical protein G6F65_021830 [Rhizopus arrhizus]KAG1318442.1 hypothetical protein G6F63_015211 [Rhizopus arrhizus]KAG1386549.1 hypothetical protein G6F59_016803 [Rhizopus arrhizus]KAG1434365.1 hypothetical protein G6F57_021618 [Rhizopus arrhizus]